MRMQVVGFEGSQGVGKKGPYEIGQVHTIAQLAPPFSENGIAKGLMGTTFRCSLELIQKLKQLQPPFMAEVTIEHVMKFGKREEQLTDIVPVKSA